MPEAFVEAGIGETRALVVADGAVLEAHVERDGGWRAGDVREVRLRTILVPGVRGIVEAGGVEALLTPLPPGLTEGSRLAVEVVREALPEAGRRRLAKVVATAAAPRPGPTLVERLRARGLVPVSADLDARGWGEAVEAAATGHVAFRGGLLTISPTPAMTVIDVDGEAAPGPLALAAASAAAAAIRRFDLAGSIGIDFPTVGDKAVRTALGAVLDAQLPPPFERTAVNGFGFVQIVRPRLRASFVEAVRGDAVPTAALALLRRAERDGIGARDAGRARPGSPPGSTARPALVVELGRRRGGGGRLARRPRPAHVGRVCRSRLNPAASAAAGRRSPPSVPSARPGARTATCWTGSTSATSCRARRCWTTRPRPTKSAHSLRRARVAQG